MTLVMWEVVLGERFGGGSGVVGGGSGGGTEVGVGNGGAVGDGLLKRETLRARLSYLTERVEFRLEKEYYFRLLS